MSLFDRYIPYQLNGLWTVKDRQTGKFITRSDGESEKLPRQWATQRAKQLNEGARQCEDQ